jgi:hypothetical protein
MRFNSPIADKIHPAALASTEIPIQIRTSGSNDIAAIQERIGRSCVKHK